MFQGDLFFKLAPLFPAYSVIPMDIPLINQDNADSLF